MMQQSVGSLPVFPSIGNNDVFPHDICLDGPNEVKVEISKTFSNFSFKLLENITANWHQWLDSQATKTMMSGGYFSMLAEENLRIVSLNTIYWVRPNCLHLSFENFSRKF